jgi:hypothetical protein
LKAGRAGPVVVQDPISTGGVNITAQTRAVIPIQQAIALTGACVFVIRAVGVYEICTVPRVLRLTV